MASFQKRTEGYVLQTFDPERGHWVSAEFHAQDSAETWHDEPPGAPEIELVQPGMTPKEAVVRTLVITLGGVDLEGNPTSALNYLQRIQILLDKEKQLARLTKC